MDALASDDTLLFEGFRLDRRRGCLLKQDEAGAYRPVAIGSRALDVLSVLAARQGAILSKNEIMVSARPGTIVEDNNLAVQISALRRILDRDRAEGSCIQTIPGRGYRFVAPVARTNSAAPPTSLPPSGNGVDEDATADERLQNWPGVATRPDEPTAQASRRRPRRGMIAGIIGALLLVGIGLAGWHLRPSGSDKTRPPPRLSIVVLPFTNLSAQRDQQYLVDAITEDLTTDLSRISGMVVISRNTAFTYRSKVVDAKQIGRELDVRYLLGGSVERSRDQVRVNAYLVDAATDRHLWADRFDSGTSDLFGLQNEITARIANTLNVELIAAEAARTTEHPDALDYIFRGRAASLKSHSAEAIGLFEQALALDPQSVEAKTYLANALIGRVHEGLSGPSGVNLRRAEELVGEALTANPRYAFAHQTKGRVLQMQNHWAEAIPEFETTLALNRNAVWALHYLAGSKILTGSIDDAVPLEQQAIRLSPREPLIGWWYWVIGNVHMCRWHPDEAIVWYEKARVSIPKAPMLLIHTAAAYALRGDVGRGAAELAEARRLNGDDRYSSITRLQAVVYPGMPQVREWFGAYFAGLRKAGMPEN